MELAKLGIGVTSFLREAPGRKSFTLEDVIGETDFVLVGMSSSPELSTDELYAVSSVSNRGVPFGVFADTFGAWKGREWFEEYRQIKAAAIFVLNEEEAAEARTKYPFAKVFGFGNPRWEEFFTQCMTREQVRTKLGVNDSDIVVEVPGGKDLAVNLAHFGAVVSATDELNNQGLSVVIVISLHPGDKNDRAEYEKLADGRPWVKITDKSLVSADDMLVGVDMVVQSASTVGVTASCQRIPVINYFTNSALDRLEKNVGTREWPPAVQGVELVLVENVKALSAMMNACCKKPSRVYDYIIRRQNEVYPRPTGKPAAALIAEAISDIIGPK